MTAPPTTDEQAILAKIYADPADDTARLVYADWLDDLANELSERPKEDRGGRDVGEVRAKAEFIRVQCELASASQTGAEKTWWLRRMIRERALLAAHEAEWRKAGPCPRCYVRVAPKWVRTAVSRGCGNCDGTTDVGALTERTETGEWARKVEFDRGFIGTVQATFEEVFEQRYARLDALDSASEYPTVLWVPTPRALAWMRHATVTRVVLTDREPAESSGTEIPKGLWFFRDYSARVAVFPSDLPTVLFESLRGCQILDDEEHLRCYPTREAAIDALAVAVCEVLRNWKG